MSKESLVFLLTSILRRCVKNNVYEGEVNRIVRNVYSELTEKTENDKH